MKLLKDFFKRTIVAIDIKKYNELKQQFDAFKVETREIGELKAISIGYDEFDISKN